MREFPLGAELDGGGDGGAGLAAWVIAYVRRLRRKSPEEIERLRRLDLHRRGRITHGHIVDVLDTPSDPVPRTTIVYSYEVAGVTYEVGQDVTALPRIVSGAQSLPGHYVLIKYDLKLPTNSIVACEEWVGITKIDPLIH